jgi:DNA-directed RNA polymerase II subunit RPB1
MNNITNKKKQASKGSVNPLDQSDEIYLLQNFQDHLLDNIVLRGVKNITNVIPRKILDNVDKREGVYTKNEIWVLDTVGTNLIDLLALDYIDVYRTVTNDIQEIHKILGIEAARQAIYNEFTDVIEFDGGYINYHHVTMLCDRMTTNDGMTSIFRHGINSDNIGPIAKASFEETPEMFFRAAKHAELDPMRGVSANVMCGQEGYYGTSSFQVMLDMDRVTELNDTTDMSWTDDQDELINNAFEIEDPDDKCGLNKIMIKTNMSSIKTIDLGNDVNEEYNPGF